MDALAMTIVLGIFVMLIVVVAFVLSVKSGQYDDLEGAAHRILMDDDDPRIPGNSKTKKMPVGSVINKDKK
jgi:cbb3-type cytochrome oxidase maturation protein